MSEPASREAARVFLSLGGNLGDREGNLRGALVALGTLDHTTVARRSGIYETAPVGKTDQPAFLNLCAEIETALTPLELLNAVKAIERGMGRRPSERWGAREIDIDIVLWEGRTSQETELTLPHPAFRTRAFVLRPLAEIAPDAVDPVTGLTVAQLAESPEAQGEVKRLAGTH